MGKTMLAGAIGLVCLGFFSAIAGECPGTYPDPKGTIRDADTALIVARAMWASIRRSEPDHYEISSVESWREDGCGATLRKGIWYVDCPEVKNGMGGGLSIELRQQDGALVMITIRQ